MTEALISDRYSFQGGLLILQCQPRLESTRRSWSGDAVREIAIPMDKRAIHLVDKLNFQNYGQEGEYLFNLSRYFKS
jgi:hypothetical protein